MTQLYNNSEIKQTRKSLRRLYSKPEQLIWNQIRNRQLLNIKFRRQYSIGNYIVDFYSSEARLAIEIDGDSHFSKKAIANDKIRQNFIESRGIKFLRFTNKEIM